MALPPACHIIQASNTASTFTIHSLIATGAPLFNTTIVFGWTADTD
jgi:hypothetical protein